MTPKRTRPLSADDFELDIAARDPLGDAAHADERHERFQAGVDSLRVGTARSAIAERILLILAGIVAPFGIVVVILGWWGASRTPYSFEQVPYLISGGLLGLALVFLGSFFYFAHWMTQLVREHREQSRAILAALERIAEGQEEQAAQAAARNGRRTRAAS